MVGRDGADRLTPYIRKSLPEHERLIIMARFPWPLRWVSWFSLVVIGAVPVGWFFWRLYLGDASPLLGLATMSASVIGILIFLVTQIYMQTTEFGLTDRRIILKRGFISRYTNEIPLDSLENVHLRQGVIQRLLGYGYLEISGSGGSGLLSPPIADPVNLRADIAEAAIASDRTPSFRARHRPIRPAHNRDRRR